MNELRRRNLGLEEKVKNAIYDLLPELVPKGNKKSKSGVEPWLEAYRIINKNIQDANLTINFEAGAWFSTKNTYDSYKQMYELAITPDNPYKLYGTAMNPADLRARVDDKVTFPDSWKNKSQTPPRRGLSPGTQSGHRVHNQMAFGDQVAISKEVDRDGKKITVKGVKSLNPYFNPKTKQLFAALNYGRRMHGATTRYGLCHFVLHPRFKVNALYYPKDTFLYSLESAGPPLVDQQPYQMLAATIASAASNMQKDIIKSCYRNTYLPDSGAENQLLEAHIFDDIPFTNNIVEVCISAEYAGTEIKKNAEIFAKQHGAKLILS